MLFNLQNLEDKERRIVTSKDQLKREHRFLQRRLENLVQGQYRVRQERSISECSTSTNSTTSSTSETGKYINLTLPPLQTCMDVPDQEKDYTSLY